MLNILIAIASASFASANTRGPLIFRVLRIEFVAEAIGIEDLLCYEEAYEDKEKHIRYKVMVFFVLTAVVGSCVYSCGLIWYMVDFEIEWEADNGPSESKKERSHLYVAICSLIFCFVSSVVIFFVVTFSTRKWTSDHLRKRSMFYKFIDFIVCLVVKFGRKNIGFIEQDSFIPHENK